MAYRDYATLAGLERWVECCWSMETDAPLAAYPVRPDGCLDILFSREEGLRVVGAMTAERRFDLPAMSLSVGVRFRPGMAGSFLGWAPGELTDQIVSAEDLWGRAGRERESRMSEARSAYEGMKILLGALRAPDAPNNVQRAIEAIVEQHGAADLESAARHANLSPRQFRRRCEQESGLAPKHLSRVLRFRRVLELARRGERPEWAGIAAEAGYFDQAHLIRDFREFTGETPMAVFSNSPAAAPA